MLREPITVDPRLVEEIVTREEAEFRGRTPRSHEIHERAKKTMPAGVSSSFQAVPHTRCSSVMHKAAISGTTMATSTRTFTLGLAVSWLVMLIQSW